MTDEVKWKSILDDPPFVRSANPRVDHRLFVATAKYTAILGVVYGDEDQGGILVTLKEINELIDLLTQSRNTIARNLSSGFEEEEEPSMSEPLSAERLTEIRARAEAATEGPWEFFLDQHIHCGPVLRFGSGMHDICHFSPSAGEEDAEFIAHARQDIPDLLIEIDRLRAIKTRPVHNHGTEEGPGLHCREHVLTDGSLLGACMLAPLPLQSRGSRWFSATTTGDTIDL